MTWTLLPQKSWQVALGGEYVLTHEKNCPEIEPGEDEYPGAGLSAPKVTYGTCTGCGRIVWLSEGEYCDAEGSVFCCEFDLHSGHPVEPVTDPPAGR